MREGRRLDTLKRVESASDAVGGRYGARSSVPLSRPCASQRRLSPPPMTTNRDEAPREDQESDWKRASPRRPAPLCRTFEQPAIDIHVALVVNVTLGIGHECEVLT